MLQEKDACPVALASDAPMTTVKVPTAVGAPDTTPVDGLIVRPGGRFAALNVRGSPSGSIAVIVTVTLTPRKEPCSPGFVTTGARFMKMVAVVVVVAVANT